MKQFIRSLLVDDAGQDLAEYGIALAVIGVAIIVAAGAIATNVTILWSAADTEIALVAGN